jgi:AcrR family transcriptional regulator
MSEEPKKQGRGRPKTLNKADVVDVAMGAYWEDGPTSVSLNAICQMAGVSKPSVYREFGNDDGLTYAALEKYAETVLGKVLAITMSGGSFSNKIKQIAYMSAEDCLHAKGCLFVKMRAVKPLMGPKTQALIGHIETMALDAFSKVLTEGRASGEWTSDIPIELGARYIHSQIGLALDQRARGDKAKDTLELALSVVLGPDQR